MVLETICEDYLLIILEDFLLTGPVNTESLKSLLNLMKKENAGYLRLMANPPPDNAHPSYPHIGYIKPGADYRTSLQMAIWKNTTRQAFG